MKFLYPGFLFALVSVVIPVLIHLFNFRRYKKVYFSNVSFLKDIQQQTTSFRKLKNYLLLASRILALIFLVLAFAKPYIPSGSDSTTGKQQITSIYIDNSRSMEATSSEGSLLDDARRRARELVSAYDLNTRFQLLTNDFEGKHQRLLYRDEFLEALDEVKISANSRTANEVLTRQSELLSSESNALKTLYILSDFQKNTRSKEPVSLPENTELRLIQLKANQQANISIDSVWFLSPVHKVGEAERLVVQFKNNSDKEAKNVPYTLHINEQQKAIGSLTVPERGIAKDTVTFSGLSGGWMSATVTVKDYPITFDNHFYFTFYVEKQMEILEISDQQPNRYIGAIYNSDPFFKLTTVTSGAINYSSLGTYPLIVLNGISSVSEGLMQQLPAYVKNGGSLIIFPPNNAEVTDMRGLTLALGTDVAEAMVSQEQKVSSINLQHPLFRGVFEQVPKNIDLPTARKFVKFSKRSNVSRQDILSFPGREVFFTQYNSGKGKIYLSAVAATEDAGNFVRHSVFVPVMFQAAFLSLQDTKLFYTIGKDQYLESQKIVLSPNQTLVLKKDGFEAIPDLRQSESITRVFIADQVKEPGIYSLIKADELIARYAFNENRSESDLSYLSEAEIKAAFPQKSIKIFSPGRESVTDTIKAVNKGVQLWKLCLILALAFLGLEVILIRFYRPQKQL